MRNYNLIGRAEKETRRRYHERMNAILTKFAGLTLELPFDNLEVRENGLHVRRDGADIAHVQALTEVRDRYQNIGGIGHSVLRLDVQALTVEQAQAIADAIPEHVRNLVLGTLTHEQLEALAFLAQ